MVLVMLHHTGTITKTGTIKTTGNGSTGIRQTYGEETLTENILTVEGSISTEGKNARAISNETNGNKTTVSGSISTKVRATEFTTLETVTHDYLCWYASR